MDCYVISVLLYSSEFWKTGSQMKKWNGAREMSFDRRILIIGNEHVNKGEDKEMTHLESVKRQLTFLEY